MSQSSVAQPAAKPTNTAKQKAEGKGVADAIDAIRERRSNELIIGICGVIGSNTQALQDELKTLLALEQYEVEEITISDLIPIISGDMSIPNKSGFEKYRALQKAGNDTLEPYTRKWMP